MTALQVTENLTDRQAAQMVARAIDWRYALGLELSDPGFGASVLSKFRTRLVEHGLHEQVFTRMLSVLAGQGLIGAGGKQRRRHARAVFDPQVPVWLADMSAVQTLRVTLVQNYLITTDNRGREVIRRREPDTAPRSLL